MSNSYSNLIVPGDILEKALKMNRKDKFVRYIMKFKSVIFSRTSPN
jgi:hypothetical protein